MYTYEENNNYIDEEKKSRLPFFIILIVIMIIIFALVLSCDVNEKDKNNNLGYLRVDGATITPEFSKNKYIYTLVAETDIINISCNRESSKAKVEGCNKEIKLSDNETQHIIRVTSESGDIKRYTLNISREKTQQQKLSVSIEADIKSGEKTTRQEVKLNAKLSDSISVKYEWYKNGVKVQNESSSSLIVKESGTYSVKVTNGVQTISSNDFIVNLEKEENKSTNTTESKESVSVTNFILKINSITGNSSSWVKQVNLKINATSSNGVAGYSFDGGKTYQKTNTKTFTSNQTVKVVVKDKKGKTVTKEIIISKVDSTIPKVTINYTEKVSKSVSLYATINPSTVPSGYKYKWYKDGKLIEKANSLTYKATSAGTYKFEVTTGAGVVASATYKFSPVAITCPTLLVTDSTGKTVKNNVWINDYIFVKITPSKETASYDVYLNESGYFGSINTNFTYYNTFDAPVTVKVVNGGVRTLKIVVKDKNGNQNICYSKNYYLK